MESFEALSNAINRKTVAHAKALGLSTSTVSKWQEPSLDFSDSGALNPLDRVETIIQTALSLGVEPGVALSPVHYLGARFGFVPLILPRETACLAEISRQLHRVVSEFGVLLSESSDALASGCVSPDARRQIERDAQRLFSDLGIFLQEIKDAAK